VTDSTPSGYQLTAAWQADVGQSSGVGSFFGTLLNGYLVAKFGQRRVVIGALVAMSAFIFITFFAPNLIVLTVGEILCGLVFYVATYPPSRANHFKFSLRNTRHHCTCLCF
jgi:MFS transporter, SP family, general alpha glucoside:H+ symporter